MKHFFLLYFDPENKWIKSGIINSDFSFLQHTTIMLKINKQVSPLKDI